jgi:hypothetical protein
MRRILLGSPLRLADGILSLARCIIATHLGGNHFIPCYDSCHAGARNTRAHLPLRRLWQAHSPRYGDAPGRLLLDLREGVRSLARTKTAGTSQLYLRAADRVRQPIPFEVADRVRHFGTDIALTVLSQLLLRCKRSRSQSE